MSRFKLGTGFYSHLFNVFTFSSCTCGRSFANAKGIWCCTFSLPRFEIISWGCYSCLDRVPLLEERPKLPWRAEPSLPVRRDVMVVRARRLVWRSWGC